MKKSNVRLFQFVRKSEKIGEVGDTGNAMGKPNHLRFSVTTILPHFWKIDDSIQGWKESFYLNPDDFFCVSRKVGPRISVIVEIESRIVLWKALE
jgi:murein DD-endopeptidase MepM/ murein hydrolase activator NlpD